MRCRPAPVSIAVALADKLDQLVGFFAIGEKPTGAGDPYALRRAALGIIRIIRENGLRLRPVAADRAGGRSRLSSRSTACTRRADRRSVLDFLAERLRVQLAPRARATTCSPRCSPPAADDDLVRLLARTEAVAALLGTEDGANLLAAYRRAANILRIESRKDGPHDGPPDPALLAEPAEERIFSAASTRCRGGIAAAFGEEDFAPRMAHAGATCARRSMRSSTSVTVNAPEPRLTPQPFAASSRCGATMDRSRFLEDRRLNGAHAMTKWVYSFGAGHNEGGAEMRNLLGGKGANLAEMASIGLPVPPGFTITTEVCTALLRTTGKPTRPT